MDQHDTHGRAWIAVGMSVALAAAAGATAGGGGVVYDGCVLSPGIGSSCTFHCEPGWSVHVEGLENGVAYGALIAISASCGGISASCDGTLYCSAHAAFTEYGGQGTCQSHGAGVVVLAQCRAY